MISTPYFRKNPITISLLIINLCIIMLTFTGCKKLVEVNAPTTTISAKNVYSNDQTAIAVLTAIYAQISSKNLIGTDLNSVGFITGLSGDELTFYDGYADDLLRSYYQNQIPADISAFWSIIYNEIYISNAAVEGLNSANSLSFSVKQQLLGEAKFLRAFCYFYLVNLYGDVPLILETDYIQNRVMSRTPKAQVWQQIITDLTDAKSLLSSDYLDGTLFNKTTEHVRPTKWAAAALLARSYLYIGDWKNAETQASSVINSDIYSLDSLSNVFLRNSNESIWQLQPVNLGANTEEAIIYIIPSSGLSSTTPVYLSPQLINSFEPNDQRKKNWIDTVRSSDSLYYFVYKYKISAVTIDQEPIEYNTVLRLGEQYLIRAEARAQLNDLAGARSDLNIIRERAWLTASTLNEKSALLRSIYHERQVELFTEWGHRWLDLKRTKMVDAVMGVVTPQKGGTWNTDQQLYPIPPTDILFDGNLTQNPGY